MASHPPKKLHFVNIKWSDDHLAALREASTGGDYTTIHRAYAAGFRAGVSSAFRVLGHQQPAPALVRRKMGSLKQDAIALQRDSERLVAGLREHGDRERVFDIDE